MKNAVNHCVAVNYAVGYELVERKSMLVFISFGDEVGQVFKLCSVWLAYVAEIDWTFLDGIPFSWT